MGEEDAIWGEGVWGKFVWGHVGGGSTAGPSPSPTKGGGFAGKIKQQHMVPYTKFRIIRKPIDDFLLNHEEELRLLIDYLRLKLGLSEET